MLEHLTVDIYRRIKLSCWYIPYIPCRHALSLCCLSAVSLLSLCCLSAVSLCLSLCLSAVSLSLSLSLSLSVINYAVRSLPHATIHATTCLT